MVVTTLKDKGQITLPSEIRKLIKVGKGDVFSVEVVDGKVVMSPQKLVPAGKAESGGKGKPVDLSKYIGIASGVYGNTVEEMDAYVRNERDSWD